MSDSRIDKHLKSLKRLSSLQHINLSFSKNPLNRTSDEITDRDLIILSHKLGSLRSIQTISFEIRK